MPPQTARQVPLSTVIPPIGGQLYITAPSGEPWDELHQFVYSAGGIVVELDDEGNPIAAFQASSNKAVMES